MNAPRPVCFMVMPYGKKKTNVAKGEGLSEIDFDAIWDLALRPAIEKMGYEPVRADQDVGALIIHEMLERLYFSDLVLAEMTIPNGNVYYEVGIRHACRSAGCVLLSASWSKQLFDVAQMRMVRYPLEVTKVDEAAASAIRDVIQKSVPPLTKGSNPFYQILPKFPDPDPTRASVMRQQLTALSKFEARMSAIRVAGKEEQNEMTQRLIAEFNTGLPVSATVAQSLLKCFLQIGAWQRVLDLVRILPDDIANQGSVIELENLAKSKLGNDAEAIGALRALINNTGATPEREGLLGGRYKKLYTQSTGAQAKGHLNDAIEHYELGMMLDLNEYYSSSNLPRLYRARGLKDDARKATVVLQAVLLAWQRAYERNPSDDWLLLTRLGAAFDDADVETAENMCGKIEQKRLASWQLQTTIADLELSLQFVLDASRKATLNDIVIRLRQM